MKISIQSLKQGITEFDETVNPDFVSTGYAGHYPNPFKVKVVADKFEKDLRVSLTAQTVAEYRCDRCLGSFEQAINTSQEQLYQIGGSALSDSDDIQHLTIDTIELDLTELLNESVILQHPIQMICSPDCKGICAGCGAELNKEKCNCKQAETDPRWDKLKDLIK